ncbi:MAG: hypothetical protein NTV06_09395, partial [candidate division Zixibacteria bacterium]|nr:hypothetical protein [candidate division Zixibacteria bacterium]
SKKDKAGVEPSPETLTTALPIDSTAAPWEMAKIDVGKYSALDWGKDPFRPRIIQASSPSNPNPVWSLGGILYNEDSPAAIINSKVVKTGQTIDGARVIRIDKKMVTLDKNGAIISLTLEKEKS